MISTICFQITQWEGLEGSTVKQYGHVLLGDESMKSYYTWEFEIFYNKEHG